MAGSFWNPSAQFVIDLTPSLRIGDALTQNLIDSKGDIIGILDDGGVVVEDGLAGCAAAVRKKEYWQAQVSLWLIVEGRPERTVPLYN